MTPGNRSDVKPGERVREMLRECEEEVKREYQPIHNLGLAIIVAATNSRNASRDWIQAGSEKERIVKEAYIFYEYIYFYMHLVVRQGSAFLTGNQLEKVQDLLTQLIPAVAIDSYFFHWPEPMKVKMVEEFIDNLNEAEVEYSGIVTVGRCSTASAKSMEIFLRLAVRISDLCLAGSEPDMLILDLAMTEWRAMLLDDRMYDIRRNC